MTVIRVVNALSARENRLAGQTGKALEKVMRKLTCEEFRREALGFNHNDFPQKLQIAYHASVCMICSHWVEEVRSRAVHVVNASRDWYQYLLNGDDLSKIEAISCELFRRLATHTDPDDPLFYDLRLARHATACTSCGRESEQEFRWSHRVSRAKNWMTIEVINGLKPDEQFDS